AALWRRRHVVRERRRVRPAGAGALAAAIRRERRPGIAALHGSRAALLEARVQAGLVYTGRDQSAQRERLPSRREGDEGAMTRLTRRAALQRLAVGACAAPMVLRGRFRLFGPSSAEYSSRAIGLVQSAT